MPKTQPRQPTTQTATVAPKPPSLPGIDVPAEIIDALVGLGLRTEQGSALLNGWRIAHPAVHPSRGAALITVGPGRIALAPAKPQEGPG